MSRTHYSTLLYSFDTLYADKKKHILSTIKRHSEPDTFDLFSFSFFVSGLLGCHHLRDISLFDRMWTGGQIPLPLQDQKLEYTLAMGLCTITALEPLDDLLEWQEKLHWLEDVVLQDELEDAGILVYKRSKKDPILRSILPAEICDFFAEDWKKDQVKVLHLDSATTYITFNDIPEMTKPWPSYFHPSPPRKEVARKKLRLPLTNQFLSADTSRGGVSSARTGISGLFLFLQTLVMYFTQLPTHWPCLSLVIQTLAR